MKGYFDDLAKAVCSRLHAAEVLLLNLAGETSDFVRFNKGLVRQAGTVHQVELGLELIDGARHATTRTSLTGDFRADSDAVLQLVGELRDRLGHLPDDPFVNYSLDDRGIDLSTRGDLPPMESVISDLTEASAGIDWVGIWASGAIFRGFANSLGLRHWHETESFNLDWSAYLRADKAIKAGYAGRSWDRNELGRRVESIRNQLEWMEKPARTIAPGVYRVYLAPTAVEELASLMCWDGFSLKSHRTAQSPLAKMVHEGLSLHPAVTFREDNRRGLAPRFSSEGFAKPDSVKLIESGKFAGCLADARSGREYGEPVNAGMEAPESLEVAGGDLPASAALEALDTGLYINHLWYGNFSDRNHCRVTGMTRFACYWVDSGRIRAPINVMRFDDTVYNLLGGQLSGITAERELIQSADTYEARSLSSMLLPGILVNRMAFTL